MELNTSLKSKCLTTSKAAEYLKCLVKFLNTGRITKRDRILFSRLGCRIRYHADELDDYVNENREYTH